MVSEAASVSATAITVDGTVAQETDSRPGGALPPPSTAPGLGIHDGLEHCTVVLNGCGHPHAHNGEQGHEETG